MDDVAVYAMLLQYILTRQHTPSNISHKAETVFDAMTDWRIIILVLHILCVLTYALYQNLS